jgi:Rod binding domain-containing protein
METNPLQRRVNAQDIPLDRLAGNPNVSEPEKLRAAARAFEAILLRQILESAQKTVIPSTLNPESTSKAIYRDLITTQLADSIARSGQFGLARSFEDQWQTQNSPAQSTSAGAGAPATSAGKPLKLPPPAADDVRHPAITRAAATPSREGGLG